MFWQSAFNCLSDTAQERKITLKNSKIKKKKKR